MKNRQHGMPGEPYGRRWRRVLRMRAEALGEAGPDRWTGTPLQRAVTTTDPALFVSKPGTWRYFHDRLRGQVFTHPVPSPEDPNPDPLPHRYMRELEKSVSVQTPSGFRQWFRRLGSA